MIDFDSISPSLLREVRKSLGDGHRLLSENILKIAKDKLITETLKYFSEHRQDEWFIYGATSGKLLSADTQAIVENVIESFFNEPLGLEPFLEPFYIFFRGECYETYGPLLNVTILCAIKGHLRKL